jgi:hypothetical protein
MRKFLGKANSLVNAGMVVSLGCAVNSVHASTQEAEVKPAWPKVGYELRTGATYDDKGFQNVDGAPDASKALTMNVERAKLKLTGDVTQNVSFFVRAGLSSASNVLDYAVLTLKLDEMFSVSAGRSRVLSDGWEFYYLNSDYVGSVTPILSGKTALLPQIAATAFEFHVKLAGLITLQLTDDIVMVKSATGVRTGGGYFTETSKQPAINLQWMGELGSLKPIVQVNSYDTNHSMMYTLGLAFKQEALFTWVNYTMDNQTRKVAGASNETDVRTNLSFHAEYQVGDFKPFVRGLVFDVKQGGTDLKANSGATAKDLAADIDDNLTNYTVGVQYTAWGEAFKPYLGYVGNQANFYKDLANGDAKSAKSQSMIKLGVMSKM